MGGQEGAAVKDTELISWRADNPGLRPKFHATG